MDSLSVVECLDMEVPPVQCLSAPVTPDSILRLGSGAILELRLWRAGTQVEALSAGLDCHPLHQQYQASRLHPLLLRSQMVCYALHIYLTWSLFCIATRLR